jgi:hypothetical protein
MIFHSSISAERPEFVARTIAAIWRGGVAPAPPGMFLGTWVVFGRDERGSLLEVHPHDFAFVLRSKANEIKDYDPDRRAAPGLTAVHFAIASPRTEVEIHDIAKQAAWESLTDWREVPGGGYGVVEVWVENRLMLEVLTPEMQAQYAKTMRRIPNVIPEVS